MDDGRREKKDFTSLTIINITTACESREVGEEDNGETNVHSLLRVYVV